jgi:hypothetical protein
MASNHARRKLPEYALMNLAGHQHPDQVAVTVDEGPEAHDLDASVSDVEEF